MINSSLLVFAIALFMKCTMHSESLSLSAGRMEEDRTGQDGFSSVLGEELDNAMETEALSQRFPLTEGRLSTDDGTKRIFILSDLGLKVAGRSDASSTFGRSLPFLALWRANRAPAGTLKDERRDDLISVARKDLDNTLLRCMIGRVYRPCWQA
ncbi:pro-MCH [Hoplias malabaricus]|uniref:pro-MCH n=1 Tax=Hoplias malabaricus TaxID=27720 RepID=UPI0034621629